MDLDTEETRETHNLYIESTRGSLKNIINVLLDNFTNATELIYVIFLYTYNILLSLLTGKEVYRWIPETKNNTELVFLITEYYIINMLVHSFISLHCIILDDNL